MTISYYPLRMLVILILVFGSHTSYTQKLRTFASGGYGFYQLYSLKEFQDGLIADGVPFQGIRAMDRFPNYYNWMIGQEYLINPRHSISVDFTYQYTGGRNHLADYSGNYALDMLASGYMLGLGYTSYNNGLFGNGRLKGFLRVRAGFLMSYLKLKEDITVYNILDQSDEYRFLGNSVYVEFGPGLVYELTPGLSLHFAAGYQLERDAQLKGVENKNMVLINSNNQAVRSNWSGFRLHTGIALDIAGFFKNRE